MSVVINGVKVEMSTVIQYVDNPKRVGKKSWTRYEEYQSVTTVGEYFEITDPKYSKPDLRYDMDHGFLTIVEEDTSSDLTEELLSTLHGE